MKRAVLIAIFLAVMPMAAMSQDNTVRERLIEALRDDGYREIRISNTFLGRLRLVATKPDSRREIVVNPNTGVILRDYIRFLDVTEDGGALGGGQGASVGGQGVAEDGNRIGSSSGGGDHDDDDDDNDSGSDDDDDDDDDGDSGDDGDDDD